MLYLKIEHSYNTWYNRPEQHTKYLRCCKKQISRSGINYYMHYVMLSINLHPHYTYSLSIITAGAMLAVEMFFYQRIFKPWCVGIYLLCKQRHFRNGL